MTNYFTELSKVDCSKDTEKKNGFTYLSWPFAVGELCKRHPEASWKVYESAEGFPYITTPTGCYIKVGVTVGAVERIQWHPVLDHRNKTVLTPDAFQVNTSIQRGLVKAIALHGLGLYIYAGEDLPEGVEHAPITPHDGVKEALTPEAINGLENQAAEVARRRIEMSPEDAMRYLASLELEPEEKVVLWNFLDSKTRSSLKAAKTESK